MLALLPSAQTNFKMQYAEAIEYLSHSAMAKEIIADLERVKECVGVSIVTKGGSQYDPPYYKVCPKLYDGGLITWDIRQILKTIDFAPNDPWVGHDKTEARPDAPWTQEPSWQGRLVEKKYGPRTRTGRLSQPVCLIHEMGHAVQYLSDPTGFRTLARNQMELEKLNIQAVEATVVRELRDTGYGEGVRWSYGGQGSYEKGTNHWTNWLAKLFKLA